MDVPSFAFLAYAALVASLAAISTKPFWRRGVFLAANVLFIVLLSHDPRALAPFAAFEIAGFLALKVLERTASRAPFGAIVVAFVAAFLVIKRYAFVPPGALLPFAYVTVGLSYVFFRVLHLMIDTHERAISGPVPLVAYLNYTLNFTSLIAGPIERYPDYLRDEERPAPLDLAVAAAALERIALGMAKVFVFAPLFELVRDRALGATIAGGGASTAALGALAIAAYPCFLYLNFSGYMDVAIGAARFLGLRLPENFAAPFAARGFIELWGRWHITLSTWLKTYVYAPLFAALVRRFPSRRAEAPLGIAAFFVTFFLIGLWHGSTGMFVVYGLLLGLGISVNKAYQLAMQAALGRKRYRRLTDGRLYRAASRGLTFAYFAFTLLWFAFSDAGLRAFAARLGTGGGASALALVWPCAALAIEACVAVAGLADAARRPAGTSAMARVARIGWSTALIFAVVTTLVVTNDPTPRIVYRAF